MPAEPSRGPGGAATDIPFSHVSLARRLSDAVGFRQLPLQRQTLGVSKTCRSAHIATIGSVREHREHGVIVGSFK